jgi:hypothetical protein
MAHFLEDINLRHELLEHVPVARELVLLDDLMSESAAERSLTLIATITLVAMLIAFLTSANEPDPRLKSGRVPYCRLPFQHLKVIEYTADRCVLVGFVNSTVDPTNINAT